jgi:hypothetical protein
MRPFLKTSFVASLCLIASAGFVAAQTETVVGTTASGDQVVAETTYKIVPVPMTQAEIDAVNTSDGLVEGDAPGPYVGWTVFTADNIEVGTIVFSVQDAEGRIDNMSFAMEDGRNVRISNGVRAMGANTVELRLTKAELEANATANYTNITVE